MSQRPKPNPTTLPTGRAQARPSDIDPTKAVEYTHFGLVPEHVDLPGEIAAAVSIAFNAARRRWREKTSCRRDFLRQPGTVGFFLVEPASHASMRFVGHRLVAEAVTSVHVHRDGHLTASITRGIVPGHGAHTDLATWYDCRRVGSIHITPSGSVTRWPGLSKADRADASMSAMCHLEASGRGDAADRMMESTTVDGERHLSLCAVA